MEWMIAHVLANGTEGQPMDPNETLRLLRAAVISEQAAGDGSYAEVITDLFEALDEWLSKGGYFPRAWSWDATNEHIHDVEPNVLPHTHTRDEKDCSEHPPMY